MATPRRATHRGLNQPPPVRLEDQLIRRYSRMNARALELIDTLLVPALEADNEAAVQDALRRIDSALEEDFSDAWIEKEARSAADKVNANHERLFFTGLATMLGIRILTAGGGGEGGGGGAGTPPISVGTRGPQLIARLSFSPTILTDNFVDENIRYVSTLRSGIVEALGDQVTREVFFTGGITGANPLESFTRPELTDRLLKQWRKKGVPSLIPTRRLKKDGTPVMVTVENHAALIARDQVSKLNGQLNRARQEAAGITEFIWETQRDSRVRPAHQDRQGRKYKWADADVIPGQPIQCRCWARAVVDKGRVLANGEWVSLEGRPFASTERFVPGVEPTDPGPGTQVPQPTTAFDL